MTAILHAVYPNIQQIIYFKKNKKINMVLYIIYKSIIYYIL